MQWEWLVPLKDVAVTETDSALFECEFSVTDVKVDWTMNGEKVEASPKYAIKSDGTKHSLNVAKCRPKDQGEVTCSYADHKTQANLTVEGNFVCYMKARNDMNVYSLYRLSFCRDFMNRSFAL